MKVVIANYNEHYLVDVSSTKDEREMLFCLVQKRGGMDAIKESDVIITLNYDNDGEYYKVEKNAPELNSVEIESLLEEFKSTEYYKPFVKKYINDFRYIVIDFDSGPITKTNELTDDIKKMVVLGYYRVIDLETMETIDSNKNGLFKIHITEY